MSDDGECECGGRCEACSEEAALVECPTHGTAPRFVFGGCELCALASIDEGDDPDGDNAWSLGVANTR